MCEFEFTRKYLYIIYIFFILYLNFEGIECQVSNGNIILNLSCSTSVTILSMTNADDDDDGLPSDADVGPSRQLSLSVCAK